MINYPQKQYFYNVYWLIVSEFLFDCPTKSRWSGSSWGRWTEWINHRRLIIPGTDSMFPSMCFLWTDGWFAVFWDGNLLLLKCLFLSIWSVFDSMDRGNEVARLNMQHMHLKLIRLTGAHAEMRRTTDTHENMRVVS